MSRKYPYPDILAEDMADNPDFYGLSFYRINPCCYKDVASVTLHPHFLDTTYEDAEDAVAHAEALAGAIRILTDRFREKGEIETRDGACGGCLERGDVDPKWLAENGDEDYDECQWGCDGEGCPHVSREKGAA